MLKMLIKKLDKVFSEFIRLRDTNEQGYGNCCTCGRQIFWKKCDAGHFIGRQYKSVRWNEKNVHAQCKRCNCWEEGAKDKYEKFIIGKYGSDQLELLNASKNNICRLNKPVLEALIEEYTKKRDDLLKGKRF